MKSTIHAAIGSGLMGVLSAILGLHVLTWQFWAMIIFCNAWYLTKPSDAA